MNSNEKEILKSVAGLQVSLLKEIKSDYQEKDQMERYSEIVLETKKKIVTTLENHFCNPSYSKEEKKQIFKETDSNKRQEIRREINNCFETLEKE